MIRGNPFLVMLFFIPEKDFFLSQTKKQKKGCLKCSNFGI